MKIRMHDFDLIHCIANYFVICWQRCLNYWQKIPIFVLNRTLKWQEWFVLMHLFKKCTQKCLECIFV